MRISTLFPFGLLTLLGIGNKEYHDYNHHHDSSVWGQKGSIGLSNLQIKLFISSFYRKKDIREILDVLRCQIEFIFACHWHQKEDVKMLHKKQKTWHIWLPNQS